MSAKATYRRLGGDDLAQIPEIDRTEQIETLYVQHGSRLETRVGDFSAPAEDVHMEKRREQP